MENMGTELTVPKWVLIVRPKKIPQIPKKNSPPKGSTVYVYSELTKKSFKVECPLSSKKEEIDWK